MSALFTLLVSLLASCAGCYAVYSLGRGRDQVPSRTWMGISLLCLGLALLALTPGPYRAVNALLGMDHAARLVAHAMTIWATAVTEAMFVYWTHPPGQAHRTVWRRQAVAAAAVTVMAVLFVAADTGLTDREWVVAYAHRPAIAADILVFAGTLASTMVNLIRLSVRYARSITDRRWSRLGLRMFTAGGIAVSATRRSTSATWSPFRSVSRTAPVTGGCWCR